MEEADPKPLNLMNAAIGLVAIAAGATASVTQRVARAAAPVGSAILHSPVLTERLHLARAVDALANRGRGAMRSTRGDLERMIAVIVPVVVREVLNQLDLNVIIPERVDLDGLIATVDIDAVVEHVDIDVIVDRVNIDSIVQRLDIDSIVQRLDIDAIVQRVDIDAVVQRLDIDAILDRVDIDAIVQRVDIDAIVAKVDLKTIVDRLNVVGIAEEVINEIDLPEIIRDSTGSMASQVVRDARMQSIDADEAISRVVDRLLRRRRNRSTHAPIQPQPGSDSISEDRSRP